MASHKQNLSFSPDLYAKLVREASAFHVTPDVDTTLSTCPANTLSIFLTTGYHDLVPPLVCIDDIMYAFSSWYTLLSAKNIY